MSLPTSLRRSRRGNAPAGRAVRSACASARDAAGIARSGPSPPAWRRSCPTRIRRRRRGPRPRRRRGRRRRRRAASPARWRRSTARLRISSSAISALQLRVERVAQAVAQQVEGEHGDQDRQTRASVSTHQARWIELQRARPASCPIPGSAAARRGRGSRAPRRRGSPTEKPSVACTISGAMQFGSTVSNISRSRPAPAQRVAVT